MKLKQIQAVELLLSKLNKNKRLVVFYDNHLISADFLSYKLEDKNIRTLVDERFDSIMIEDSESSAFFGNLTYYRSLISSNGNQYMHLGSRRYELSNNIEISPIILKEIVNFVKITEKENKISEFKTANITPRNVEFIGTNEVLPFYLFPEDAEFTPVSILDRELTFD